MTLFIPPCLIRGHAGRGDREVAGKIIQAARSPFFDRVATRRSVTVQLFGRKARDPIVISNGDHPPDLFNRTRISARIRVDLVGQWRRAAEIFIAKIERPSIVKLPPRVSIYAEGLTRKKIRLRRARHPPQMTSFRPQVLIRGGPSPHALPQPREQFNDRALTVSSVAHLFLFLLFFLSAANRNTENTEFPRASSEGHAKLYPRREKEKRTIKRPNSSQFLRDDEC